MPLSEKQRGVFKGIIVGAVITIVVIFGSIYFGPELLDPGAPAGERVAFALAADLLLALWLGVSVGRLARHRFLSPEDIDGGGLTRGTEHAKVLQATLQNTLEQTVLAVLAHSIWIVTVPVSWAAAVPAAVCLFIVGRLLFVWGYGGGAPSRAIGFALTFYPSMLMLVISALWLLRGVLI